MTRMLSLLALTALLFVAPACSEKKVPDQAAIKTKNVLTTLRDLGAAYEHKDLSSFMANVAPVYPGREAFSKSLGIVFSKNQTIRFNIQYSKMLITVEEKGNIRTTFNWDGEWHAVEGTTQKNGGQITLVFEPRDFKLLSIDGKDPFVPHPAEIPGKP
jgi:hypothetical protein